ncbi:MAG: DUF45 domain-containing protein [Chloroflexi bacterium]|nr:DUF45 domain-containing protein [Chloroflexota bacterium]
MVSSCKTCIDGIGLITLERSLRARRVVIYVKPVAGVRVAVPTSVSFKRAEEFVILKKDWIKKHLHKMKEYDKQRETARFNPGDIDVAAAKRMIISRLERLSGEHGFRYNRVSIRCQRTRWGSCSHKNNISLNVKLVKLPSDLMDYVLLHELVHTRIHNHSEKFWVELDRYVGNARTVARKLRTNGLELL